MIYQQHAWAAILLLVACCLAGCGIPPEPAPSSPTGDPSPSDELIIPLPATAFPDACRGVAVEAILHGNPTDARVAWLIQPPRGEAPLVWPPGWTARFVTTLEVLDETGAVRYREGSRITNVCRKGTPDNPDAVMIARQE